MRRFLIVSLVVAFAVPARAEECVIDRDLARCPDWGAEWIRPEGWELSEQTSYPGILVAAVHRRGGGRMTLAAQRLAAGETLQSYVARSRARLKEVGFRLGRLGRHATGAAIHELVAPDGANTVRQGYFVHAGTAYVITLAAPRYVMRSYVRAFDDALRNLSLERSAPEAAPAPGSPDAPAEPAP